MRFKIGGSEWIRFHMIITGLRTKTTIYQGRWTNFGLKIQRSWRVEYWVWSNCRNARSLGRMFLVMVWWGRVGRNRWWLNRRWFPAKVDAPIKTADGAVTTGII